MNVTTINKRIAKVRVQFCGAWGYDRYYAALSSFLLRRFPGQVEMSFIKGKVSRKIS